MPSPQRAFQHTFIRPETQPQWEQTLYAPLRELFYSKIEGISRDRTLVVGGNYGNEVPASFRGTLVDINADASIYASQNREAAKVVCADAMQLPFRNGSFDFVVESLVLSQLQRANSAGKREGIENSLIAHAEAERVLSSGGRLFVIDTVKRFETTISNGSAGEKKSVVEKDYFDINEVVADGRVSPQGSFVWNETNPVPFVRVMNPDLIPEGEKGVEYLVKIYEIKRQ